MKKSLAAVLLILASFVFSLPAIAGYKEIEVRPGDLAGWFDYNAYQAGISGAASPEVLEGYNIWMNTRETLGSNGNYTFEGQPILPSSKVDCNNCHAGGGLVPFADPVYQSSRKWAAPKYWRANNEYTDLRHRIIRCLANCDGGMWVPRDHEVVDYLTAYVEWVGSLVTDPAMQSDYNQMPGISRTMDGFENWKNMSASKNRGAELYDDECRTCHGDRGKGEPADNIPPLWGNTSVPQTALGGLSVPGIARFIRANMPLGDEWSFSAQNALDVAAYFTSKSRPHSPLGDTYYSHIGPEGIPNVYYKNITWVIGPKASDDPFADNQRRFGPWKPIEDWQIQRQQELINP